MWNEMIYNFYLKHFWHALQFAQFNFFLTFARGETRFFPLINKHRRCDKESTKYLKLLIWRSVLLDYEIIQKTFMSLIKELYCKHK